MSAPDITPKVMENFVALSSGSHLTVVLGAGASAPSGLPSWHEFATRLAVSSGLVKSPDAARALLGSQDPSIVLEGARYRASAHWPKLLNSALYGDLPAQPDPSPLHHAAAGHFLAAPNQTTLATLNFDLLLEKALSTSSDKPVTIDTDGVRKPGTLRVHHLHGALFQDHAWDPIVGYRDFAELVARPKAWQREFLADSLERGPLLLTGTSYRDPDIRHWLHQILYVDKAKHPALVTIVREGLGLDRETFDSIDDALEAEWEAIGLTALKMQDLSDIALVLRELNHLRTPKYRAPSERIRAVWDMHTRHFSELQQTYRPWLQDAAKNVQSALRVKVHRPTLWLADAKGRLARWASPGATFASVRHLKFVPTGWDSPWIAGEALAAEETKLRNIDRDHRVAPTWRSVLAVPILVGDGHAPEVATAVLTFGLATGAATLLNRQAEWSAAIAELSTTWGTRLGGIAFPQ